MEDYHLPGAGKETLVTSDGVNNTELHAHGCVVSYVQWAQLCKVSIASHSSFIIESIPAQGLVFDYYVDDETGNMVSWANRVPKFLYDPNNFAGLFVPTIETTRLNYIMDLLSANKHHVMLVGGSGMFILSIALLLQCSAFGQHLKFLKI